MFKPLISFSTGSLYHLKLERIFKIAKDAGFEYLELMLRGKDELINKNCWEIDYLKSLEDKYKVKIITVHSPIDFEFYPEEYLPKIVELTQKIKAKYLIIHLPKIKDKYKDYQNWFAQFKDQITDQPIQILIENMGKNKSYSEANQFMEFPNFCFDTCHILKENADPIKIIKQMDNVRQFHLSYFDGQGEHLKPTLNKELFRKIIQQEHQACRCLELKPESFTDTENDEIIIKELKTELNFLKSI